MLAVQWWDPQTSVAQTWEGFATTLRQEVEHSARFSNYRGALGIGAVVAAVVLDAAAVAVVDADVYDAVVIDVAADDVAVAVTVASHALSAIRLLF